MTESAVPNSILVRVWDESDLVVVRGRTRDLAARQGLSEAEACALATAVTEIAMNIVVHAGSGEIIVGACEDSMKRGVIVTARDTGPGIHHIEQAMQDDFSTIGSLGCGLPGARRLVDDFEIESNVYVGTTIVLRKWASDQPR